MKVLLAFQAVHAAGATGAARAHPYKTHGGPFTSVRGFPRMRKATNSDQFIFRLLSPAEGAVAAFNWPDVGTSRWQL